MTATINITAEITEFALKVREQLADLAADEVDDLTDGLEADMAEAFAERPDFDLPDAGDYALELRNAAGLPPREARAKGGIRQSFGGVADSIRLKRESMTANIRESALGAGFLDLLVELRPIWWVLRAWVAYQLVGGIFGFSGAFPSDFPLWLALGLFVLVSVQWGRRHWLPTKRVSGLIIVGNVIAAVALLPVLAAAGDSGHDGSGRYGAGFTAGSNAVLNDPPIKGLAYNGQRLQNIYAYDAAGKPLHNVQLFDVDGKPLETDRTGEQSQIAPSPVKLETGVSAYNVYPLKVTEMYWDENGEYVPEPSPDPDKTKAFANGPFLKVPAVLAAPATGKKVDKGND